MQAINCYHSSWFEKKKKQNTKNRRQKIENEQFLQQLPSVNYCNKRKKIIPHKISMFCFFCFQFFFFCKQNLHKNVIILTEHGIRKSCRTSSLHRHPHRSCMSLRKNGQWLMAFADAEVCFVVISSHIIKEVWVVLRLGHTCGQTVAVGIVVGKLNAKWFWCCQLVFFSISMIWELLRCINHHWVVMV